MGQSNLQNGNEQNKNPSWINIILWIVCLVYVISPVDLFPGPIDDVIVSFVALGLTSILKH